MQQRFDPRALAPAAYAAMLGLSSAVNKSELGSDLIELVEVRVSQINSCGFCLAMHLEKARAAGVSQRKLDLLAVWREAAEFAVRERAALAWAETLTRIADGGVPQAAYDAIRGAFDETEIAHLTYCVAMINGWNRIMAAAAVPAPTP